MLLASGCFPKRVGSCLTRASTSMSRSLGRAASLNTFRCSSVIRPNRILVPFGTVLEAQAGYRGSICAYKNAYLPKASCFNSRWHLSMPLPLQGSFWSFIKLCGPSAQMVCTVRRTRARIGCSECSRSVWAGIRAPECRHSKNTGPSIRTLSGIMTDPPMIFRGPALPAWLTRRGVLECRYVLGAQKPYMAWLLGPNQFYNPGVQIAQSVSCLHT